MFVVLTSIWHCMRWNDFEFARRNCRTHKYTAYFFNIKDNFLLRKEIVWTPLTFSSIKPLLATLNKDCRALVCFLNAHEDADLNFNIYSLECIECNDSVFVDISLCYAYLNLGCIRSHFFISFRLVAWTRFLDPRLP